MKLKIGLLAFIIAAGGTYPLAAQPTEADIENAIVAGLSYLVSQQNPAGYWYGYGDTVGYTGLVLLKLNTRAIELGLDPLGPDYEYAANVQAGLNYLYSQIGIIPIFTEPAGDPDCNGNGIGMYVGPGPGYGHIMYNTSLAAMAFATSGHPEIYGDELQDIVDFLLYAQADVTCGPHRGGWRYNPDQCSSDNSNSGYVTLALGFAETPPPYGFGLTIPAWVKDELSIWIDVIQDDVNGDANDGGSWYSPNYGIPWVNILKTGNLMYEMGLVGDTLETVRLLDALDYIERHWGDPGGPSIYDTGWLNSRQAMFTMMKGLASMNIEYIDLDDDGVAEHEWYPEVAQHLLDTQLVNGSWPYDPWGGYVLSTAWALLTLERPVPQFTIPVSIDVKPGSCPNPVNVDSGGVVSVAIVGTEDFDVTTIDPTTVTLACVPALRWAYEDVATPYPDFLGEDCLDCHELEGDGFVDLVFKFDKRELAVALGEINDGDCLVVTVNGALFEDFGGTGIVGEDVILIIMK